MATFIRFAAVLALSGGDAVFPGSGARQRSSLLTAQAKDDHFRDNAKLKADVPLVQNLADFEIMFLPAIAFDEMPSGSCVNAPCAHEPVPPPALSHQAESLSFLDCPKHVRRQNGFCKMQRQEFNAFLIQFFKPA